MTLKKISFNILKLTVIVLPFIWILTRLEFKDLGKAISEVAWWTIPVLVFNILLSFFLQGFRWWVLLRGPLKTLGLGTTLRYHYYGIFYSIVLPGSAAQDVVKGALISRHYDYSQVWGATWTFKLLGLISLILMSVYGFSTIDYGAYSAQRIPTEYIYIFVFLIIILTILSFSKRVTRPLRVIFSRLLPKRVITIIENIRQGVYQYKSMPLRLTISVLLGILTQSVLVLNSALVIRGITGTFYISECFAFIPIIEVLCMIIPLTPNGTGIRESLTAVMFRYLGLSAEQLAIYIALGLIPVLLKLVGAVSFIFDRKPVTAQTKESQ